MVSIFSDLMTSATVTTVSIPATKNIFDLNGLKEVTFLNDSGREFRIS